MRATIIEPFPSHECRAPYAKHIGANGNSLRISNSEQLSSVELDEQHCVSGGATNYPVIVVVRLPEPLAPETHGARLDRAQRVDPVCTSGDIHLAANAGDQLRRKAAQKLRIQFV